MNRRLAPVRQRARNENREPSSGLSAADVIGPLHASFMTVVDTLTDRTMQAVAEHFEAIKFRVEHDYSTALRNVIRKAVIEKLIAALREHANENETEPDVVERLRVITTREMMIELFTSAERDLHVFGDISTKPR